MAHWKVTISGKGVRKSTIEKIARATAEAVEARYKDDVTIVVTDATPPESRADRFEKILGLISEARSQAEELRDELTEWKDNLPENLQNGSKADELEDAASALDDLISDLENSESAEVSFPSMM